MMPRVSHAAAHAGGGSAAHILGDVARVGRLRQLAFILDTVRERQPIAHLERIRVAADLIEESCFVQRQGRLDDFVLFRANVAGLARIAVGPDDEIGLPLARPRLPPDGAPHGEDEQDERFHDRGKEDRPREIVARRRGRIGCVSASQFLSASRHNSVNGYRHAAGHQSPGLTTRQLQPGLRGYLSIHGLLYETFGGFGADVRSAALRRGQGRHQHQPRQLAATTTTFD